MSTAATCSILLVAMSLSLSPASAPEPDRAPPGPDVARAGERHDALAVPSRSQIAGALARDETAVKDLVSRYNSARDRQDAAALAALLTEGADQLVSSGEWRRGRAALVSGMLQSSKTSPGDRTITVDRMRFLSPDVALVDARYDIAGSGGTEPRRMWSAFVAVRTSEGWRIDAIRNMLPAR
jgi:uncharacterized protein (TIGR02246 family)